MIGHGSRATVYEATQLSLGRRVALKVLHDGACADRVRRLTWPEHPGAVRLFGTGESAHGPWLAMRLVAGGSLATRGADLDGVAAALAHAHAAGIVHGDVTAANALVEGGRAFLSDFGLGREGATAEDDRTALAALLRAQAARHSRRRRTRATVACLGAAAVSGTAVVAGGGTAPEARGVPVGTGPLGSALAPGAVESVDCGGHRSNGASPACTISPRTLAGRPVVVSGPGTIVSWSVRGADGTLALQVLRGRGRRTFQVDRSADEVVPNASLHTVQTRMAVAGGDRVALLVAPGAAVGLRRAVAGAAIDRWFGPLSGPARPPEQPAGTGLDGELLLRVAVRPGAEVPTLAALRGERAARAPAGRRVASGELDLGPASARTAVVSVLGGAVAVDLFDGARRLARSPVPGADGRGRLLTLRVRHTVVRVAWRNSNGRRVTGRFAMTPDGLALSRVPRG